MNNKIKKIIRKKNKSKIVCLTAYSKNIAEIVDNHVDIVLVGDSLGSVLYNYNTTRKVNLKMMIEHTKSVRMGVKKSLLVIDLPYNTYRNKFEALKNSINIDVEIMEYGEHALGQGADAEAVTYIQIRYEDLRYSGVAISKDIVTSSINAFMGATSQLLSKQRLAA